MSTKAIVLFAILASLFCFVSTQQAEGATLDETVWVTIEGELTDTDLTDFWEEEGIWSEEVWENGEAIDTSADEACFYDETCIRNVNFCNTEGCCFWKECDAAGACNLSAVC